MKSVYEDARDCLTELIPMLERELTPQPDHLCGGPNADCDNICVENVAITDLLMRVRRVQNKLDKIIHFQNTPHDDLEVPGQKVDAYARTPASETPHY